MINWDDYKTADGKLEYKMQWSGIEERFPHDPDRGINFVDAYGNVTDWMTWKQTSEPVEGAVVDYEAIDEGINDSLQTVGINPTFHGLHMDLPLRTTAFVDGNNGPQWFYACGMYDTSPNLSYLMDGNHALPILSSGGQMIWHTKVALWLRVPEAPPAFSPADVSSLQIWYDVADSSTLTIVPSSIPQVGETYLAHTTHTNDFHSVTAGDIITITDVTVSHGRKYNTTHGEFISGWFTDGHFTLHGPPLVSVVSQVNDKSGNDLHATRTVEESRPEYLISQINNKAVVSSPSSNGFIGLDIPSASIKEIYIIAYYKTGTETIFKQHNTLISGSGSSGRPRVMGAQGSRKLSTSSRFNDDGTFLNGSTTNTDKVLPMPPTLIRFSTDSATTELAGLLYNAGSTSDNRGWKGGFGEFVALSANASTEDREKLEGYLAHKWGLSEDLPSDHPYKNEAPQ